MPCLLCAQMHVENEKRKRKNNSENNPSMLAILCAYVGPHLPLRSLFKAIISTVEIDNSTQLSLTLSS